MTTEEPTELTLGLKRGTVRLTSSDDTWPTLGQQEVAAVQAALDGLGCKVEHVGSTAVPGLLAKPILDVAVGTPSDITPFFDEVARRLAGVGLVDRGRDAGGGRLFIRGDDDRRVAHVHVLPRSDPEWSGYLQFRDFLRAHAKRRDDYTRLKEQLAVEFPFDRGSYTKGKADFITETLRLAGMAPP